MFVSEELATTARVELDALVGEPRRVLFDPREARRLPRTEIERALDPAPDR